jgi:hypothetical protein
MTEGARRPSRNPALDSPPRRKDQDEAPVVPTLGQVVWHINGNYPSQSSHGKETISGNRLHLAASRKDELQLISD